MAYNNNNNNNDEFKYSIINGISKVLEEKGDVATCLRKVQWGDYDEKWDIRRWKSTERGEQAQRGCTLTDEGAAELLYGLIDYNVGDTSTIIKKTSVRKDFNNVVGDMLNIKITEDYINSIREYAKTPTTLLNEDETLYDPNDDNLFDD